MEKEEKHKKKIILLFFIFILVVIISIGGTYAWFLFSSTKENRFTTGEIKHEIMENFQKQGASQDILPDETVNKDVWIHNIGKSDALLRVKITPVWVASNGTTTDASGEIELIYSPNIGSDWSLGTDGYYYYNHILSKHDAGAIHQTENNLTNVQTKCFSKQLLDAVKLKSTVSDQNKFAGKTFDVIVVSETIQVNLDLAKNEWNIDNDASISKVINGLVASYVK